MRNPLNRFYFNNEEVLEDKVQGGVKVSQQINTGTQLGYGIASAKEIKFSAVNLTHAADWYIDKAAEWKVFKDGQEVSNGNIYVKQVSKRNNMVEFTCYDSMCLFDVIIDDWLNAQIFPTTLLALLQSLCEYCGVELETTEFTNNTATIYDNITSGNLTGRTMLQWIAQEAACFAVISGGKLALKRYTETDKTLDNSKYAKLESAEYSIDLIEKVQVQVMNDDIGVIVGEGTNTYTIQNNPLFYTEVDEEIRPYVQAIYDVVKSITYVPMKITLLEDYGIECGDIITVNGKKTYVMSKTVDKKGCTLQSFGTKTRDTQTDNVNLAINALRGKYNVLRREVDITESELGNLQGDVSNLTQTVDGFNLSILNIEQVTKSLNSELSQLDKDLSSSIEEVRKRAELSMTSDEVSIKIQEELVNTGVDNVVTGSGFTFNDKGLTIDKTGSLLKTNINEDGMRVTAGDDSLLIADKDGVQAKNLSASTYLIIGKNSRFEDYDTTRTGCFWIGS